VALIKEFMYIEDEVFIELQAGSCVNTVDTKLWLRVMVLAFIGAVQLAESAKTVVRPPIGHVGQLEFGQEGLPAEPLSKIVEDTVVRKMSRRGMRGSSNCMLGNYLLSRSQR
jgi:hypothetical protein